MVRSKFVIKEQVTSHIFALRKHQDFFFPERSAITQLNKLGKLMLQNTGIALQSKIKS